MDILDMPMSMLFPSELSSTASSTPPSLFAATTMVYPHNLLGVDSSQDELLLMHHHQQIVQLQQLQHRQHQQQQHELQLEMAKIGLGTPPSSPFNLDIPLKQEDTSSHNSSLFNILESTSAPSSQNQPQSSSFPHHSQNSSYSNLEIQGQPYPNSLSHSSASMAMSSAFGLGAHNGEAIECEFFQSNHVTSSLPDSVQSIIGGVNTSTDMKFSMGSPTIPKAMIKRESPPPTVLGNQTQEIDTKASFDSTTSPKSFPSYQNFGDYEGSLESSYSSSSDRSDSQERELKHSPNSSLPSFLQDFQSPSSSSNSQLRRKARPKSMIVSSTSMSSPSLLSPSISMQPYISPFHNDSMSAPISSPTGMASHPRHDRRRSSSGSYYGAFSSSAFASPISHSSYIYNSDQVHNQHQHERCYQDDQKQQQKQQQQRSQIQYHPQQQHFQHLLDPSMVPEITDIHVCPVCQRRFTRPFNLRSHIMTHTTARPFPCDECHWKFTRQHDLLRHKRAKHPGSVPPPTPKTPKTPKVKSEP